MAAAERAIPDGVPGAVPGTVSGTWQHRKATFNYFGVTTLFTCDGLESHVKEILLLLGARRDAKVIATGCPGPYNQPTHTAFVRADFYALAPATDAAAAGTVQAHWAPLRVEPLHPSFMTEDDCELIEEMKDFITQNFSLRDIEYRTTCVPRQLTLGAFAVKGQSLQAVATVPAAVKG
jgi:hypothetical protein